MSGEYNEEEPFQLPLYKSTRKRQHYNLQEELENWLGDQKSEGKIIKDSRINQFRSRVQCDESRLENNKPRNTKFPKDTNNGRRARNHQDRLQSRKATDYLPEEKFDRYESCRLNARRRRRRESSSSNTSNSHLYSIPSFGAVDFSANDIRRKTALQCPSDHDDCNVRQYGRCNKVYYKRTKHKRKRSNQTLFLWDFMTIQQLAVIFKSR